MTDNEVEALIKNLEVSKLEDPVVALSIPLTISGESIWKRPLKSSEYPVKAQVEILTDKELFNFDVRFVYDAILD